MSRGSARPIESIQWQPQERLGQLAMDAQLRPWLIGKGLLTQRLRSTCGARFALRLVDQWTGLLSASHRAALRTEDNAGLFRDVEMCCGDSTWVFGQTIVPDTTLCAHPWLAELGESALGETLGELSGVERGAYEYAWLPAEEAVTARALRDAQIKPAGLWARRARIGIRGAPLLTQELFLPAMGRV
ncbi:MAG TPA: chorismate lyase [Steroidobacteraceae bacterium]|jgi:chorismate--pyruvate lyase|nr:chorismate lyase [Steroidobacteraceae bacterium]